MAVFHYKAVGGNGKLVDGEMEASDATSVITQLRATGHLPISAEPKSQRLNLGQVARRFEEWRGRIKSAEITAITRELATLLNAGIPIDASLRILERHAPQGSTRLKGVLQRVHADVQSGKPLSTAFAAHDDVFDALYVNLVCAGEASGAVALVMTCLAEHRERVDTFKAHLVSALTYPVALVCVAVISLFVLMTFVIPRFIPLFSDAGATLPLLTEMVFFAAQVLQSFWWVLIALLVAAKIAADRWFAAAGNRVRFDRWVLRAPIAGELLLLAETVRFARTLETLLRNGLPLLGALKLVKDVQRNRVISGAIDNCMSAVRSGGRLADALARERVLPSLLVELVAIGEESGELENMLQKAADTFEARTGQKLKRMLTLLEPVLILGLGAVIAVVIVAILLAMLGLNELVV